MLLRVRLEGALDDHVASRPSGVDIALGQCRFPDHVAVRVAFHGLDVARTLFVDQRRVGLQRLFDGQDRLQRLVFDLDQLRRQLRGGIIARGDGRDRLADIAHLAGRKHRLVLQHAADSRALNVRAGDDRFHAWQRFAASVISIAADARMRMRALRHRGIKHARPDEIVEVARVDPRSFLRLKARNARADGARTRS